MIEIQSIIIEKMNDWAKDFDANKAIRIDKKNVHKKDDKNICVSRIEQLEGKDNDSFISQISVDITHPFFFDHPYDHIPGMLIIESGRQMGTAISHMFYNVSHENVFILNNMESHFYSFATIKKPLFCISKIREKKYHKDQLVQMTYDGFFVQGHEENKVAYMKGVWNMYNKKTIERIKKWKH